MRKIITLLCLLLLSVACNGTEAPNENRDQADPAVTKIYLVRHAEKDDGEDPDLTDAGRERATRLSQLLAEENILAVYSTNFRRTRQTATPTADLHGLPVSTYDPGQLERLAKRIEDSHRGGAVLVVGHSNTTPELATMLSGGQRFDAISEDDYGNLLVISISQENRTTVERRTY